MMKLLTLCTVITAASAFTTPPLTFAVGKKAPAKKAAATKPVAKAMMAAAPKAEKKPVKNPFTMTAAPKMAAAKKVVAVKKAPVMKAAPKMAAPKKVVAVKKAPVMKAAPVKKTPPAPKKSTSSGGTVPSIAIPGESAPDLLDGSLVGDVGFDPCFLSTKADGVAPYFNKLFAGNAPVDGLTWYREAELMHGRICMIAVLGFIVPGFGTLAGNEWTGPDAFSTTNPLEAISAAPSASLFQIFAFMAGLEFRRIKIISEDGPNYQAGNSQRWGQFGWNPLGLDYTPEEFEQKQLQEIKHARLAMIGLLGLIFQANASGVNVVEQWSSALTTPEYVAKAGYFLPVGI